jgi:hypothetical protein
VTTTDAVMAEIRERVHASLRDELVARGAEADFADQAVFDEVDALFRRALERDRHALLVPALLNEPWRPELSLNLTSHRGGLAGSLVLFAKRRFLLPLTRWLFEYALENFRRQDQLNVALLSCLQSLAAEHVKLRRELDAASSEIARVRAAAPTTSSPR